MGEFHETRMGQKFYLADVPRLVDTLERIAKALEMGRATKVGRLAEAAREVIKNWESGDLAKAVRELDAAVNS